MYRIGGKGVIPRINTLLQTAKNRSRRAKKTKGTGSREDPTN